MVQDVLTHYFEEEAHFVEAVKRGEEALQQGEYLTHEQAGQQLQRFPQPRWKSVGRCPRRKIWSGFANLRGGWLPPPVRCERGSGPIGIRPDPA